MWTSGYIWFGCPWSVSYMSTNVPDIMSPISKSVINKTCLFAQLYNGLKRMQHQKVPSFTRNLFLAEQPPQWNTIFLTQMALELTFGNSSNFYNFKLLFVLWMVNTLTIISSIKCVKHKLLLLKKQTGLNVFMCTNCVPTWSTECVCQ